MTKGSIIAFFLLFAGNLAAQKTQFEISRFDGEPAGKISVYSNKVLLGVTDAYGYLPLSNKVYFEAIHLEQDGHKLSYEITDTTNSFVLASPDGKAYKIMVVPDGIEEVLVRATRAGEKEPFARTEVQKAEIEMQNTGRDIPVLLQYQPSVITNSDAGNGVGYTGIRVRGSDASRTNITVNGVPINDAESQGTFWVNMPDLASSVQSIQIQRGAGSSTNGAGAFGATVNVQTATGFKPYGMFSNSFGSYNTRKSTVAAGTGLIGGHWTMDMRLSKIKSDGFVDRAASDLGSYFFSGGYYAQKWSVKLLHFAGAEHTYQAWYGIPTEKMYGPDSMLQKQYYRNVGIIYRTPSDSVNLFQSGSRTYNYYTYENETDNYNQAHYHLYFNYNLNAKNNVNVTLYRTRGKGYFEQWRPNDAYASYGLPVFYFGGDSIDRTELIRRRWLDNTLTGINANYRYNGQELDLTVGGGYSQYFGNHFGEIVWARIAPSANYLGNYYNSTGDKFDGNIFVKTNYSINTKLNVFADLQLRRVYHEGLGMDNDLRRINFQGNFLFFNPKFGVSADLGKSGSVFASVAVANKEPSRSDFTDNVGGSSPLPERMTDLEIGWQWSHKKIQTTANLYYMNYQNQLVLSGAVNDVGTPLRTNVAKSYRAGVELAAVYIISKKWLLQGNVTFSKNRISEINIKTLDYFDDSVHSNIVEDVPISYSPDVVGAASIVFTPGKNWSFNWNHKYVGKQYLDNTGDDTKSIKAYYFSELGVNKRWNFKHSYLDIKLQCLNVLSALYNNNGYTYEYYYGGKETLTKEVYLFPSAPRNFMAGVVLGF